MVYISGFVSSQAKYQIIEYCSDVGKEYWYVQRCIDFKHLQIAWLLVERD